jgi:hypothetical protein
MATTNNATKAKTTKKAATKPAAAEGTATPGAAALATAPRAAGEVELGLVRPLLEGLDDAQVQVRPFALDVMRKGAAELTAQLSVPEVAARLEPMLTHYLEPDAVTIVGRLGKAAGHVGLKLDNVKAAESRSPLGEALVSEAEALRETMSAVLGHTCKKRPAVTKALADIEAGRSHRDLASALGRLAVLYVEHHDRVTKDLYYRDGQVADAERLQAEIDRRLDDDETALARWTDLGNRLYTALAPRYEALYDAARVALRGDPRREALKPLHAYRPKVTTTKAAGAQGDEGEGDAAAGEAGAAAAEAPAVAVGAGGAAPAAASTAGAPTDAGPAPSAAVPATTTATAATSTATAAPSDA